MTFPQLKKRILSMQDNTCKIDPEYGIKKTIVRSPWSGTKYPVITLYFAQGEVTPRVLEIQEMCKEEGYLFRPYFLSEKFGYTAISN